MRISSHLVRIVLIALTSICTGCATQRPVYYKLSHQYSVSDPEFAETLGNLLGPQLVGGNKITTLLNGDQIFPAMLQSIHSARKTVDFETYIYWSGTIGHQFCDAFAERARAGVKVHVMLDWYGANKIDASYIKKMADAGVAVQKYHPFHLLLPDTWLDIDHRTHRKILVVDGTVGFIGGVGIADVWSGNAQDPTHWRDSHYRVEGPVVAQLQGVFIDNWMQTTGEVLQGDDYFPHLHPAGTQTAQIFKSSVLGGSENMQLLFLLSIAAASRDVRIESAYFVPDQLTIRNLLDARRRGVRVTIIVPGPHIDERIVRKASHARWGELLNAGIEIYEFQPTMFHCKQLIVDDRWVSIGSSNMDNRSFHVNDEANLNVYDPAFAADQLHAFEEDKKRSRQFTFHQWSQRPFLEKISDGLLTFFCWEL